MTMTLTIVTMFISIMAMTGCGRAGVMQTSKACSLEGLSKWRVLAARCLGSLSFTKNSTGSKCPNEEQLAQTIMTNPNIETQTSHDFWHLNRPIGATWRFQM